MADRVDRLVTAARMAVDRLFGKAKLRLGVTEETKHGDKRMYITADPAFTIPGLYIQSVRSWGAIPRLPVVEALKRIAGGYLDAHKEAAKAAVARTIHNVIRTSGGKLDENTREQLATALGNVLKRLEGGLERIAATEGTAARNLGGVEAITVMARQAGVADPVTYFAIVKDGHACKECMRLHMLDDKVTPRVWKMSEIGREYHTKGATRPSMLGLHPHCRCTPVALLPGYGFDGGGNLRFIAPDHDEWSKQRGLGKAEAIDVDPLVKAAMAELDREFPADIEPLVKYERDGVKHIQHFDVQRRLRSNAVGARLTGTPHPKSRIAKVMQEGKHRLTINFDGKALDNISAAGKFLNQLHPEIFESGGALDPEARRRVEGELFGIPHEAPGSERPVYGAVQYLDKDYAVRHEVQGGAGSYGWAHVVLKPHVQQRTTITPTDSFGVDPHEVFNYKDLDAVFHHRDMKVNHDRHVSGYQEAQIHGGVHLHEDVAELHVSHPPYASDDYKKTTHSHIVERAIAFGQKYGIPVYNHTCNNQGIYDAPQQVHTPAPTPAKKPRKPRVRKLAPPASPTTPPAPGESPPPAAPAGASTP